ncbi:hypothetical protein CEXT_510271 [Caerostris extrusa]|uniref:Uncharacterized protein n=1 Tax=Caerostris extrusa TaxID=172846 RepID=A0AAV4PH65_CAEEX|nr:hypothetical protein CEXT_510271 [Caerostris extrusa]
MPHPPAINCRMAHALNMILIRGVCDMTQIVSYFMNETFIRSRFLEMGRGRHEALIDLCLNGTVSHGNVLFLQQMGIEVVLGLARD